MPANDPATRLEVCVLPKERTLIKAFANALGKSTSEFVRECVMKEIKGNVETVER